MKKTKRILLILLGFVLILGTAAGIYLNDYYRADQETVALMTEDADCVFNIEDDGTQVFLPEGDWDTALIFYPGGKVECDAYRPLLVRCAEEGVACLLVEMPGNLAVLDMGAAQRVRELYPEVENWYLAGHSLGGSMAASFASEADWVDGLILLAAYSTADVTRIPTLSIYGTEDGVMNREKYAQYRDNLPDDLTEFVIEGGNHAFFGVYGSQEGDGEAEISNEEQIGLTVSQIISFIK